MVHWFAYCTNVLWALQDALASLPSEEDVQKRDKQRAAAEQRLMKAQEEVLAAADNLEKAYERVRLKVGCFRLVRLANPFHGVKADCCFFACDRGRWILCVSKSVSIKSKAEKTPKQALWVA